MTDDWMQFCCDVAEFKLSPSDLNEEVNRLEGEVNETLGYEDTQPVGA